MAKKKAPARKGGAKKAAPKKGAKKVVKQQAFRPGKATAMRDYDVGDGLRAPYLRDVVEPLSPVGLRGDEPIDNYHEERLGITTERLTVEEQFAADYAAETARRAAIKNTQTPKGKGKFWTRFQSSETGRFVSAVQALADKARSFGRRVLRKPAP